MTTGDRVRGFVATKIFNVRPDRNLWLQNNVVYSKMGSLYVKYINTRLKYRVFVQMKVIRRFSK